MQRALMVLIGVLAVACSDYNVEGSGVPPVEAFPAAVPATYVTDVQLQLTQPQVDVLFVLDNTPTMVEGNPSNLDIVYDNLPSFMDYFVGSAIDYHIGVISTNKAANSENGKLTEADGLLWVDLDTPDPVGTFTAMGHAIPEVGGLPANESGIATAYNAIETYHDTFNAGFLRDDPDASLHIIVMSDEDDQSGDDPIAKGEFIQYLLGLGKFVTFNSIVCQQGDNCDYGFPAPGIRYMDVSNQVGPGIIWPVDNEDYGTVLEQLGLQAAGFHREYFLTQLPVPGTISVTVVDTDGTDYEFFGGDDCGSNAWSPPATATNVPTDWTYSPQRNSITFCTYIPPALSQVELTYESLSAAEVSE